MRFMPSARSVAFRRGSIEAAGGYPGMARDRRGHVGEPPLAGAGPGHAVRARGGGPLAPAPVAPRDVVAVLPVRARRRAGGDVPRTACAPVRRRTAAQPRRSAREAMAEGGGGGRRRRVRARAGPQGVAPHAGVHVIAPPPRSSCPPSWGSSTPPRWRATWRGWSTADAAASDLQSRGTPAHPAAGKARLRDMRRTQIARPRPRPRRGRHHRVAGIDGRGTRQRHDPARTS